jgi:hypothetical protein
MLEELRSTSQWTGEDARRSKICHDEQLRISE